jgi:clan AA aspartic protease
MIRPKRKWRLFRRKTVKKLGESVGATYITVAIRNPHEPERVWEGEFLIDTGAVDTLVPRQHLEAIGIAPKKQRTYGLADGQELIMDIAGADIEFMEESTYGTVIFGAENVEPLLGVTALESVGVEVDPHNATLNKLPASRLKGFGPRL